MPEKMHFLFEVLRVDLFLFYVFYFLMTIHMTDVSVILVLFILGWAFPEELL